MAKSTPAQSSIFDLLTPAPDNATSSPESAAGPSPSTSRAGLDIAKSGPPPSHVSRFRSQENEKGQKTSVTSGPFSIASSASDALQSSLANRLRRRMGESGSPLYALTWKRLAMPSAPHVCQLAASARLTGDTAFSGWPTAATRDGKGGYQGGRIRFGKLSIDTLDTAAQLAAWPTPLAGNADGSQAPKDASPTGKRADGSKATVSLPTIARLALGSIPTGFTVGTANGGQLNPALSLWLMGFPAEWESCAPQATPSLRKSRRNLSEPT